LVNSIPNYFTPCFENIILDQWMNHVCPLVEGAMPDFVEINHEAT